MSGRPISRGSTNQSTIVRILTSATGAPDQGITDASAGLNFWYRRELGTITGIPAFDLASGTTTHTDGGLVHLDDGYYRLDLPDAAVAATSDGVMIGGAVTSGIIVGAYHALVARDFQAPLVTQAPTASAVATQVWDLAAGDHTAAGTFGKYLGGAPTASTLADDVITMDANVDLVLTDTGTTLDAKIETVISATSATGIANAVWNEASVTHTSAGTFGIYLGQAPVNTSIADDIAAVKADSAAILIDTAEIGAAGAGLTAIWDVAAATHTGAGSFGLYLGGVPANTSLADDIAATNPTASAIGIQVWDLAAGDHTAAGTFGKLLGGSPTNTSLADDIIAIKAETAAIVADTDVIDDATSGLVKIASDVALVLVDTGTTLDGRIPSALVGGKMDAIMSSVGSNAITAGGIATDAFTAAKFAADVTTEFRSVFSGTADAITATTLSDTGLTQEQDDHWNDQWILFTSGDISGQTRLITDYDASQGKLTWTPAVTTATGTPTYEILPAVSELASADLITAATVADAVWDEATSGHVSAGSFGKLDQDIEALVTATGIANAVWDEAATTHTTAGSFGIYLGQAPTNTSIADDIIAMKVDTAAILVDTAEIGAAGAGLTAVWDVAAATHTSAGSFGLYLGGAPQNTSLADDINALPTTAEVNAQVVDALNVDTYAEPGQGLPPATTTLVTKIGHMYKAWRNRTTNDGTDINLYNDDATTIGHKAGVSTSSGTVERSEWRTGA